MVTCLNEINETKYRVRNRGAKLHLLNVITNVNVLDVKIKRGSVNFPLEPKP